MAPRLRCDGGIKLSTHHAPFVGTYVETTDDDRRMTRTHHATIVESPHTPHDGSWLHTRRPTTVEADSEPGGYCFKLGTHHATFVGTTIVVCADDGRRSSNDLRPHTPCDDRRMTAHTTRRQLAAHTTADNS